MGYVICISRDFQCCLKRRLETLSTVFFSVLFPGLSGSDVTGLEPADAQHIEGGPQGAVSEPVFAYSELSGPVIDGDFDDAEAGIFDEGWQEAVNPFKGHEGFHAWGSQGFKRATGIVNPVSGEAAANGVGDTAGESFDEGIFAMDSVSADEVGLLAVEGIEEGGDIRRIVLQVAVEEHNFFCTGRSHSGDHGRALSCVGGEAKDAHAGVALDAGYGVVLGSIIHENQLVNPVNEGVVNFPL